MRRTNEPKWVMSVPEGDGGEGGEVFHGLALGSDFCAEHEWGTRALRGAFGLDESKDGLERRTVGRVPEGFFYVEAKTHSVLGYTSQGWQSPEAYFAREVKSGVLHQPDRWVPGAKPGEKGRFEKGTLACAWDEKSFGIAAWGTKRGPERSRLRLLNDAFRRLDVAFWSNVGPFHLGGGLIFAVASKVPEESRTKILAADLDAKALKEAAAALGVEQMLRDARRQWYALSPAWASSFKEVIREQGTEPVKTEHPVLFWLNPMDQRAFNFGWFTVEQLGEWAVGKGPVMKQQ